MLKKNKTEFKENLCPFYKKMSQEQVNVIDVSDLDVKYPVKDFDGYFITKSGKVYNNVGKEIKYYMDNGYRRITIATKLRYIHRLVANTFIGDTTSLTVNHIDGNTENNCVDNLEIVTQKENNQHAQKNGLVGLHAKPVIQKDKDDNFIAEYPNIKEAVEKTGCDRSMIIKCCNGERKTSLGFKWEYKNPEDKTKKIEVFEEGSYKFLEEYPNYFVLPDGRIYSQKNKKFLKPVVNKKLEEYVTFMKDGKKKNFYIGNLVATLYIPNPENKNYVYHIDGNKSNNKVENLKWG